MAQESSIMLMGRRLEAVEDELHEVATRFTGLEQFGDPAYRQGLRALLAALATDLQLSESAYEYAYGWILGLLIGRLHAQRGWIEHPQVLATSIHRPVVITGLPRTGTTALHKLLAVDPQFQGLEYWLAAIPMIRPPRETWEAHPVYRTLAADTEAFYTRMSELRKAHEIVAGEVEECGIVLMQSFVSAVWSLCNLPTYARWQRDQSARESYRHYADVLRLIGAREPHRRWVLKDPFHLAEIDTLLETFPGACVIHTHRDPLESIPSLCSLMHMTRPGLTGEATQIGPRQCAYWHTALERARAASRKHQGQFFHIGHRRFSADPLGTVRSIYEYFGLALAPHVEQQMRAWIAANGRSKHGEHRYAADTWGITPAQICAAFADYRAEHRFGQADS